MALPDGDFQSRSAPAPKGPGPDVGIGMLWKSVRGHARGSSAFVAAKMKKGPALDAALSLMSARVP
ncbi:hypothetical protein W911_16050 [Hyphomicrobium nitrativorans NL23]|uniref:Uncharacterized protein n=1 Tax=Hyphomicrobium nitrativorans NL23 TaxID=1029756 RepID=V5SKA6_9HYPH|nr:hypothetical protein W911_16050 [Hyphomicrobium nitrativorans NL23]